MDESFKRPGSVPFQWEIKPGIPKPYFQYQSKITTLFAPKKLKPPPVMTPPASPSPSSSPAFFRRSKRQGPCQGPRPIRARSFRPEIVAQGCVPLATVKKTNGNSQRSTSVIRNKRSVSGLVSSSPAYSVSCFSPSFTRPAEVREEVKSVARWLF